MNVRIGYSVGLDKVPEKITEMLDKISMHKAAHLMDLAMHMIELGHHHMGATLLDDSRKVLAEIDQGLNEAQSILKGYLGALETEETPLQAATEVPDAD